MTNRRWWKHFVLLGLVAALAVVAFASTTSQATATSQGAVATLGDPSQEAALLHAGSIQTVALSCHPCFGGPCPSCFPQNNCFCGWCGGQMNCYKGSGDPT